MDNNKPRSAQGGASIEASRWKTAEFRQRIVKKIMDTLFEHARRHFVSNPSEVKKIAESLEEKANAIAKDETDYLAKISSTVRTLVASYQNSCRDEASSTSGLEASAANMDWQEEAYQRVKRIKSTYFAKLDEIYQYTCNKLAQHQRNLISSQPEPTLTTKFESYKLVKKRLEEVFVHLNVTKTQITPAFKEKLVHLEEQIQGFMHNLYPHLRGQQTANVQRGLQLLPSQSGISQGETPERKPNLQVKHLHSSPLDPQIPQQDMMHLQGQSAKQVSENKKSEMLVNQVPKEPRSTQQQQNQLSSMKGDSISPVEKYLAFSNCDRNIVRHEITSDELQSSRAFVIDSPGISPSALLEEYCCNQNEFSLNVSGDTSEQSLEDLPFPAWGGNTFQEQTSNALKSAAPYLIETHGNSPPTSLQDCCNPNKVSQSSTFPSYDFTRCLVRAPNVVSKSWSSDSDSDSDSDNVADSDPHMKFPKQVSVEHTKTEEIKLTLTYSSPSSFPADTNHSSPPQAVRKCMHCETTGTPQWRAGPMGPRTLCNACGIRYRSGHLFPEYRPAGSPTFCPSLHSSSHKEVLKMRTKAANKPTPPNNPVDDQSSLREEIKEINKLLIDAEVVMSEEEIITTETAGADYGFVVECFFRGITIDWKAMAPQSMIKPLRLLIPINYPVSSPIFLDERPVQVSQHIEDLSAKAKTKLCFSLRNRMPPFSIRDIVTLWESCTRQVFIELAQRHGGGTFSSKYGEWEKVYY